MASSNASTSISSGAESNQVEIYIKIKTVSEAQDAAYIAALNNLIQMIKTQPILLPRRSLFQVFDIYFQIKSSQPQPWQALQDNQDLRASPATFATLREYVRGYIDMRPSKPGRLIFAGNRQPTSTSPYREQLSLNSLLKNAEPLSGQGSLRSVRSQSSLESSMSGSSGRKGSQKSLKSRASEGNLGSSRRSSPKNP